MRWSEAKEQAWHEQTQAVASAVRAWRDAHPHATLAEIEALVREQVGLLAGHLTERVVEASAAAQVSRQPLLARPGCATCGERLRPAGRHRRDLLSEGGQVLRLEREYAVCPTCGVGVFPPG